MKTVMTGSQRRKKILELMRDAKEPLSGGALGKETGVSRHVVVQDIALLRTQGYPIVATARGYIINESYKAIRLFKVHHSNEQIEDELNIIIDLGGSVQDVMVNHRAYGKMSAPLQIKSRRDIQTLLNNLKTGKSTALLNLTSGYHFHHVAADTVEILDEIEESLKNNGFLVDFLPYEREDDIQEG